MIENRGKYFKNNFVVSTAENALGWFSQTS